MSAAAAPVTIRCRARGHVAVATDARCTLTSEAVHFRRSPAACLDALPDMPWESLAARRG